MIHEPLLATQAPEFLLQALQFLDNLDTFPSAFFLQRMVLQQRMIGDCGRSAMEGCSKWRWTLNPAISRIMAGARPKNTQELNNRNALVLNPSKATLSSEDLARKQGKRFHLRVVREQQFQLMPLRWGAPEDQSRSDFNSRPCEGGRIAVIGEHL